MGRKGHTLSHEECPLQAAQESILTPSLALVDENGAVCSRESNLAGAVPGEELRQFGQLIAAALAGYSGGTVADFRGLPLP